MKKTLTYSLYGIVVFFSIIIIWRNITAGNEASKADTSAKTAQLASSKETKPAEKIEAFVFHSTQRCISCITIGKFTKSTIEQQFPNEYASGKIDFREINIDLPENKELATKFKATGSALFINSIIDGKDNIQEDTQVWRLVANEQGFSSYLSDKLRRLL